MSHPIFSNNKYVFWKVHADVIKVNINTSYFEKYVEVNDGNFNPLKFKTKKLAKDYIEKNMLNKFDSYPNKNIKLYKNIKIQKWHRFGYTNGIDLIPAPKQEKIKEFKVAQ